MQQYYLRILLLHALFLAGCGYEGDGELESFGVWPFSTHTLELPPLPFESGKEYDFSLGEFPHHGRVLVSLKLSAARPARFHELGTIVKLRLRDGLGMTYFYRNGPLNEHYLRMAKANEAKWPNNEEWSGDYEFEDSAVNIRAVPFDPEQDPIASNAMTYSHLAPFADDLVAELEIGTVPADFEGTIQITLSSGWK